MKCPRCQQPNPPQAKFCFACGTPVDRSIPSESYADLKSKIEGLTRSLTVAREQLAASSEILRVISQSQSDIQPVFDSIIENAVRLCDTQEGSVFRFDGHLIHLVASETSDAEFLATLSRVFPRAPGWDSPTARAILTGAITNVPDIAADSDYYELARELKDARRTVLSVPMLRDGQPIGTITVARRAVGPFTDDQIELLKTFADQAVIAIENVRLFTELKARNHDLTESLDRQTATADILRAISQAQTDVQPVFESIADSAMRLLAAWATSVSRYDGELISVAAARGGLPGSADAFMERSRPHRPTAPPEQPVLTKRVHQVEDVETDPSCGSEFRRHAAERGFRAFVAVPMLRGGDPLGTIVVGRAQAGRFSPDELALLQTFADQAVIAVENARLLTELQARTADLTRSVSQLTALGEVGRAVSSTLDLETVLTTIVSRAVQLSGLDGGVVFEYDAAAEEFVQRAQTETPGALAEARRTNRIRRGEGVLGQTAITLEPVQGSDITLPGAYAGRLRENLIESGIRAILAVPMVYEGHLIGCLGVTRNGPGGFPAETIELMRTFATQSALAIQNARLFREIEEKSQQLEVASQHKSEFLANMSHELRTPLNAIIGFSEVLSERMFGDLNAKQEEYLRDIYASGQHLLSLINDILDLSKIEAGRMELELTDFHLPTALDNALTLVRERAGRRGIALHITTDERLDYVRGDERKIRQVILNLLSNAIKFTPEGGRIGVRTKSVNESVEISVSDTGVGIAPEDQEAIFEEFRQVGTADKKVEGTGLGLALSRKFIELHGGRIWVESQVGVGSTFTFGIPLRHGE
jgi:signal transduction histidine kinase